jgi:hypothetical protein
LDAVRSIRNLPLLKERRWLVVLAGLIALAFFGGGLLGSASIFRAFVMGGVSALIVMGMGGSRRACGEAALWKRWRVAAGEFDLLRRRVGRFGRWSAG